MSRHRRYDLNALFSGRFAKFERLITNCRLIFFRENAVAVIYEFLINIP